MDPFAGSGTTAVSAKKFDRNFILIEKSLKYCTMAQTRLDGGDWRNDVNDSRTDSKQSVQEPLLVFSLFDEH
ncbi:MAG: hypothetical protein IJ563_06435 [Selenomonadaceae bacterium]|nr:hypothetical protein [Selenomonadaceae bacterium]